MTTNDEESSTPRDSNPEKCQPDETHPRCAGLSAAEVGALHQAREQVVTETVTTLPASGPRRETGQEPARTPTGLTTVGFDVVHGDVRRKATALPSSSLAHILEQRRSATARTSLGPIELPKLLAVLTRSYRVQNGGISDHGVHWEQRPVPSAGAIHPFELLISVHQVAELDTGYYVFDAHRAGLRRLTPSMSGYAQTLDGATLRAARRDDNPGASIHLVANVGRVTRRYNAALTLLMRDAGVLAQTLHLVATDLGMASSLIGSAGHMTNGSHPAVRDVNSNPGPVLVNCGSVILGSVVEPSRPGMVTAN